MSSCATLFVRSQDGVDQDYLYPATTVDTQLIYESGVKGEPILAPANSEYKNSPVSRLLFILGGLVDLPVSVLTDTVLLPLDVYLIAKDDDPNEQQ